MAQAGSPTAPPSRAELEARDASEAATLPKADSWGAALAEPQLGPNFWIDPDPGDGAVLSADRIRAYHYLIGGMIRPFQEKNLNAASYDLTLGPRCLIDGDEVKLSARNPVLKIPPGSIAIASPREMLLLPHWLVATFNLKSEFIFNGLLMGSGPQVDPGFMGVLGCPLHNISCEPVFLRFDQPFAKIDFVRTTLGSSANLSRFTDEDALYAALQSGTLTAKDGEPLRLWPREENFKTLMHAGKGAAGVKGSLKSVKDKVDDFRRKLRLGGLAIVAALATTVALAGALGAMAFIYTDGRVDDAKEEIAPTARAEARHLVSRMQLRDLSRARATREMRPQGQQAGR